MSIPGFIPDPNAGQPGAMPPPMGGPPGMPPMMPGGDPSMGGPPPGPPPQEENPIPTDPFAELIALLRTIADQAGEEAASTLMHLLPPETLDLLINAVDRNPEDMAFLERLIPDDPSPEYDPTFVPPPKPKADTCRELAENDHNEWLKVRERMRMDLDLFHGDKVAINPKTFDKDEDLPWYSSAMSDEARMIIALLGGISPAYQVPWVDPDMRDPSQQAEDALYYWDQVHEVKHLEAGNNSYRTDVASYLVLTGYVVSRMEFDPADYNDPFPEVLLNPATVVPTWDDSGLLRVTRKYTDTVANVIAQFERYDPKVRNRLLKAKRKNPDSGDEVPYRLTDPIDVYTYHDRWWRCVIADEITIVPPVAHKYGKVPYIVVGSGNSEPVAITQVDRDSQAPARGMVNTRSRLERKHQSWFGPRARMHAQKEEILGVLRTIFEMTADPPMILEQDDFAQLDEDPEIHKERGGLTKLKAGHEKLSPFIENPSYLSVYAPLFQNLQMDEMTNKLPPAFSGVSEAANQSGHAMEGLYENGKDKLGCYFTALASFYTQRAIMRLRWFRDWGHLMQDKNGDEGSLTIPYQRSSIQGNDRPPGFALTPRTLKRCGIQAQATLSHLRMQNLAPLGNAASIWLAFGGGTAREFMEMRGVRNPDAIMEERRYELVLQQPEMLKALAYSDLLKRDPVAAAYYKELVTPKPEPPPPGMGGPMGPQLGMSGPVGGGPDVNTSAMNLAALGMGQQGPTGRPAGPSPGGIQMPPGQF